MVIMTAGEFQERIQALVAQANERQLYHKVIGTICAIRDKAVQEIACAVKKLKYEVGSDTCHVDFQLNVATSSLGSIELRYWTGHYHWDNDHVTVKINGGVVFEAYTALGQDTLDKYCPKFQQLGTLGVRCYKPGNWEELLDPERMTEIIHEDIETRRRTYAEQEARQKEEAARKEAMREITLEEREIAKKFGISFPPFIGEEQ